MSRHGKRAWGRDGAGACVDMPCDSAAAHVVSTRPKRHSFFDTHGEPDFLLQIPAVLQQAQGAADARWAHATGLAAAALSSYAAIAFLLRYLQTHSK